MIRMYALTDWVSVPAGGSVGFDNPKPRNVRVEVMLETPGLVNIATDTEGVSVACYVAGRETIEFWADGPYVLGASSNMYVYTSDLERVHIENEGGESYTRIVERRQRNPELEAMERRMHENMQRMLAQTQAEREVAFSRRIEMEMRRRDEQRERERAAVAGPAVDPVVSEEVPAESGSASESE